MPDGTRSRQHGIAWVFGLSNEMHHQRPALPRLWVKGKQVRDNIHSYDLVNAFWEFFKAPRCAEVYNIGGGRHSCCSMLQAIEACEKISARKLNWEYVKDNRIGDHIWWISSVAKFQSHYPQWRYRFDLQAILQEIHAVQACGKDRSQGVSDGNAAFRSYRPELVSIPRHRSFKPPVAPTRGWRASGTVSAE